MNRIARTLNKRAARWVLNRLLARVDTLQGSVGCVTSQPGEAAHITLDHVNLQSQITVIGEGFHPHLEIIRTSLLEASYTSEAILTLIEEQRRIIQTNCSPIIHMDGYLISTLEEPRTVAYDCNLLSIPPLFGRFLYHLIRHLKPRLCLELGTAYGFSTVYILAAFQETDTGHLYTIEGDQIRRNLALENVAAIFPCMTRLTSLQGMFNKVLPELLSVLPGTLNAVFDDGDHIPEHTLANFDLISPRLSSGGLFLIDDIYHLNGNRAAWATIRHHPDIVASVEINGRFGICVKR